MSKHPDRICDVVVEYVGHDEARRTWHVGEGAAQPMTDEEAARFDVETHELLFSDGTIAVTFFEHAYAVWYVTTGQVMHGKLWKPGEWRLTEESLGRIAAYVARERSSVACLPDIDTWRNVAARAKESADAATPDWYVDPRRPKDVITGGPIPISHITIARVSHYGDRGKREITDEQGRLDAAFMVSARAGVPMLTNIVTAACDALEAAHRRIAQFESRDAIGAAIESVLTTVARAVLPALVRPRESPANADGAGDEWRLP